LKFDYALKLNKHAQCRFLGPMAPFIDIWLFGDQVIVKEFKVMAECEHHLHENGHMNDK